MIKKLSVKIVEYLIKSGAGNKDSKEEYVYGIELMIEKFITYTVLLFLAIYFKLLISSTLFVVFFVLLRGYTGGYHANTYIGCLLGTISIYVACTQIIAPIMLHKETPIFMGLIIVVILILKLSPINHPNLAMDSNEIMTSKKRVHMVLAIETIYIFTGSILGVNFVYIVYPFLGMVMCTILLIIAKIIKQEVKVYEEKY